MAAIPSSLQCRASPAPGKCDNPGFRRASPRNGARYSLSEIPSPDLAPQGYFIYRNREIIPLYFASLNIILFDRAVFAISFTSNTFARRSERYLTKRLTKRIYSPLEKNIHKEAT